MKRFRLPGHVFTLGHPDDEYKRYIPMNLVHHAVPADPYSPRNVQAGHSPASWRLRIAGQASYVNGNAPLIPSRKPAHLPARRAMPLDFVARR